MNERPESSSPRKPSAEVGLEQQILAVELRMLQRRRRLLGSWNEVEHAMGQVLAPRAWLWPLALGGVAGCLLGLLWRRGDRSAAPASRSAHRGRAHGASAAGAGALAGALALLGPWLRSLLTPLVHQWLRPAVLEAAEGLMLALLGGVLKTPAQRHRARPVGPAAATPTPAAASPAGSPPAAAPSHD
ncbi:hypothetical protein [Roseateles flavus]|uniref:DUF3618 domain-containing protein n=1 Tax=Roseateles flavus TaxID=3149041 RepID=A0ABV0GGU9_9BURK